MQPSLELQELTRRIVEAVSDRDVDFVARNISRQADLTFFGADPDEWWTDLAGLSQALAGQREAGVTVIRGDPLAFQEENVGWAVDPTARFRLGDQEIPFRFSVVYRREDGAWKMVHFHSSVAVSNEEAIGIELPD